MACYVSGCSRVEELASELLQLEFLLQVIEEVVVEAFFLSVRGGVQAEADGVLLA